MQAGTYNNRLLFGHESSHSRRSPTTPMARQNTAGFAKGTPLYGQVTWLSASPRCDDAKLFGWRRNLTGAVPAPLRAEWPNRAAVDRTQR